MDADTLCDRLRAVCVAAGPNEVFQRWRRDAHAAQLVMPDSAVLTTSTRSGRASARTVCFRRMDEGRFVFLTDSRSKKCRELAENPEAVVAFLWALVDNGGQRVAREVRVAGSVRPLAAADFEDLYWALIPNRRIRAYICEQGSPADWDRLKERHDQLLVEVDEGKRLPMPAHFVAYELRPTAMEFYEQAEEDGEPQSLLFSREDGGPWRADDTCA